MDEKIRTECLGDGRVIDIPAFWSGIQCSITEFVINTVAIDSQPMKPCTVCLGASYGDWLGQLVTPEQYQNEYNKILIFLVCVKSVKMLLKH